MHREGGLSRTLPQGCPLFSDLVWASCSFLSSLEHEGSGVVVKKLSHTPVPFGYWGERVCFQLPYNPATHTTMILVCVYKYTCSVMFVTHGNQGHGGGVHVCT